MDECTCLPVDDMMQPWIVTLALSAFAFQWLPVCQSTNYPVLLVVIDGFRHDYLTDYPTPSLDRIINLGVHVPSVVPEFPATTDAFLASLLTGRHTADHGIFAEHIFSEANQTVTDLSQPLLWKHVKSLGTLWDLEPRFCTCDWPHAHHLVDQKLQKNIFGVAEIKAAPLVPPPESNVTDDKVSRRTSTMKAAPSAAKPAVVVASSPASVAAVAATTKPEEKDISGSETTAAPAAASGFEARWTKCIDPIISRLMEGQVRFASVFVDVVGKAAMTFGPESEEVRAAVEKADAAIGQLLDRLKAKDLWPDKLNLIVTGTPGYATLTPNHLIDLSAMVDPKFYMTVGESPVLNIRPLEKELLVYEELRKGEKTNSFKVYIKEEFPGEDHYASNENVQELIVVADEGFAFATADMKERLKELDKKANRTSLSLKNVYGLSGYNQTLGSMQTTLMAAGPQFANDGDAMATAAASASAAEDIRVVDIFTLLCNLLEVEPRPQPQVASGQINRVKSLLRYPSDTQVVKVIRNWMDFALMPENVPITIALGVTALTLVLVMAIACIRFCCCRNRNKPLAQSYRYSQVKTNRRHPGKDYDETNVHFEGVSDDRQTLLTEVPINDEDEEA